MLRAVSGRRPLRRRLSVVAGFVRRCDYILVALVYRSSSFLPCAGWIRPQAPSCSSASGAAARRPCGCGPTAGVDFERIGPHLAVAVIAAEDQRFPDHFGFDFRAIGRALEHNALGRTVRGASTISQQTARIFSCGAAAACARGWKEAGLTSAWRCSGPSAASSRSISISPNSVTASTAPRPRPSRSSTARTGSAVSRPATARQRAARPGPAGRRSSVRARAAEGPLGARADGPAGRRACSNTCEPRRPTRHPSQPRVTAVSAR